MKKELGKKNTTTKQKARKLRLNKETIKDLEAKTEDVKGGALSDACRTAGCYYVTKGCNLSIGLTNCCGGNY